jgi:hypothetical protein
LDGRLKLFAHTSISYLDETNMAMPLRSLLPSLEPASNLLETDFTAQDGSFYKFNVVANAQVGGWSLNGWFSTGRLRSVIAPNASATLLNQPEDRIDCSNPQNKLACQSRVNPGRINRDNLFDFGIAVAVLRYRQRFWDQRIGIDGRAFIARYEVSYNPVVVTPPSQQVPGGLSVAQRFVSYRAGLSLDSDIRLPAGFQLLLGGELFFDYLPVDRAVFKAQDATFSALPFSCPDPIEGSRCPALVHEQSDRLTGGALCERAKRIAKQLAVSGGARVQLYAGKRALDPVVLFEGAAVWSPFTDWNVKLNYAEGFRPPSLQKTDSGQAITYDGNPDLEVERSRAIQGEINARLLEDVGGIRSFTIRADYAYTWVDDFIIVRDGIYQNVSQIGVHTVEMLARLSLQRGHSISIGYTLNDATSDDDGKLRSIPAQWLTTEAVFNLWRRRVIFATNLTFMGAFEDPNQRPGASAGPLRLGDIDASGQPRGKEVFTAGWTDRVFDRVGSTALWNASLRWLIPSLRTELRADVYNILDTRAYNPEGFMDLSGTFESVPAPWRGVSFMLRAKLDV